VVAWNRNVASVTQWCATAHAKHRYTVQCIRTRSRHYVVFTLLAYTYANAFAAGRGVTDLRDFTGPHGQSIKLGK
jgi:hypothetical protein